MRTLAEGDRIVELARMLAGLDDTDTGRAHAEELLGAARAHREADRAELAEPGAVGGTNGSASSGRAHKAGRKVAARG